MNHSSLNCSTSGSHTSATSKSSSATRTPFSSTSTLSRYRSRWQSAGLTTPSTSAARDIATSCDRTMSVGSTPARCSATDHRGPSVLQELAPPSEPVVTQSRREARRLDRMQPSHRRAELAEESSGRVDARRRPFDVAEHPEDAAVERCAESTNASELGAREFRHRAPGRVRLRKPATSQRQTTPARPSRSADRERSRPSSSRSPSLVGSARAP